MGHRQRKTIIMQFSKNAGHLSHFAGRGTSGENAGRLTPMAMSVSLDDVRHIKETAVYPLMQFSTNYQKALLHHC